MIVKNENPKEDSKMEPKGKICVENGLLTYRGAPAIIISKSTQGRLIREMHDLVGSRNQKVVFWSHEEIIFDFTNEFGNPIQVVQSVVILGSQIVRLHCNTALSL